MTTRIIQGLEELRTLEGQVIGTSDWVEITQERIQMFADATGDQQWIHTDPQRAAAESLYGSTIAHGFLTLSLGPALGEQIFRVEGFAMALNYGLNRVRFPNAVRCGVRVRMTTQLVSLKELMSGVQATFKQTFEIEGETKPACVAENVVRLLD